jgi:gas vesicle protein
MLSIMSRRSSMAICKRCRTFVLGVGLGAVAGILLAPKSGAETRAELFGGQLDVMAEPGTETMAPLAEEPESSEDLKARIEETRERLKAEIEAQQEE